MNDLFNNEGRKPFSIEVATLVWQGWTKEEIATQLGLVVETLERIYGRELKEGKKVIEGRVSCELVKRALNGDDKSLHLLAKSKFGFSEPKESPVQVNMGMLVELPPEGDNVLVDWVKQVGEAEKKKLKYPQPILPDSLSSGC